MRAISVATKGWIHGRGIEVATKGIISAVGIAKIVRREILRFTSKFTKLIGLESKFDRAIDGT